MTQPAKPMLIAAIPCLNEGQFIGDIVTRARRYVNKVIVIDDGSTDNTSEAAQVAGAELPGGVGDDAAVGVQDVGT